MKDRKVFNDVFGPFSLFSMGEITSHLLLIEAAKALTYSEAETLRGAYEAGPLSDGDVVSGRDRDELVSKGLLVKVVVMGSDGFNACTHKGAWVHRCRKAMSAATMVQGVAR